jgi:hypothetical protein
MTPTRRLALLVLGAAALLVPSASRADQVTTWNENALDAIRATSTNPPRATRALAITHLAIFDAVNGINRRYEPYLVLRLGPQDASPRAAAAAAGYRALKKLFPAFRQELAARYDEALSNLPDDAATRKGIRWGRRCAQRVLRSRAADGANDVVVYTPTGELGFWQPTPPAFAPALLPQWPFVAPFAMTSGDQFRIGPPPALDSAEYAEAYNEVKDLGDIASPVRTADQTEIAFFWEDGAGTATPPGHWMTIAQQLADRFRNKLTENARLFALLAIAQADAAIVAWDCKYHYDHVRPYTAITLEAGRDGNPETMRDRTWFNLLPTPPFPTYTSGHSTFSSSSARILAHFFGTDEIAFSAPAPDPQRWPEALTGVVRSWSSLSEAAEEAGQSRIYGGIHWQYDNTQALASGRALADHVFESFLQPLGQ